MKATPGQSIFLALAASFFVAFAGFLVVEKWIAFHPESKWETLSPSDIKAITIEPRLDVAYSTVRHSVPVTNTLAFPAWFKAIASAQDRWKAANRDCGPRGIHLTFTTTSGDVITFNVWMCDSYNVVSCREMYLGQAMICTSHAQRYSRDLRHLVESALGDDSELWVSADRRYWSQDALTYIGNGE